MKKKKLPAHKVIRHLQGALLVARNQVITLGGVGDPRYDIYGDKIQGAVLDLIDLAMDKSIKWIKENDKAITV